MHSDTQTNFVSEEVIRFKELASAYVGFARLAGVNLVAFRNDALPLFTVQSKSERKKILDALQVCVDICNDHRAQGHAMNESPMLIWNSLKRFGLRPSSSLFSHITNDQVIEIYSAQGIQIFRSFNFYKFCSYSLEELYCHPWYTLYHRDDAITKQLMDALVQFFSGKWADIVRLDIPPHSVKELLSPAQNTIMVSVSHIAPLFGADDSSAEAVLAIESAELAATRYSSWWSPILEVPAIKQPVASAPSSPDTTELQ